MKIEVVYSLWGADGLDEALQGGEHEIEKPSAKLLRSIAGAEAAGVVRVVKATREERIALNRHVQSQEDGEKAYAKAQGEPDESGQMTGPWQHGNHVDFIAQRRAVLKADEGMIDEPGATLTKAERAAIERDVAEAEARLAEIEEPT